MSVATLIALALKPFLVLAFAALIVIPIKLALERVWPDGPVKRFLFRRR